MRFHSSSVKKSFTFTLNVHELQFEKNYLFDNISIVNLRQKFTVAKRKREFYHQTAREPPVVFLVDIRNIRND